jgi:hypothetical protein
MIHTRVQRAQSRQQRHITQKITNKVSGENLLGAWISWWGVEGRKAFEVTIDG